MKQISTIVFDLDGTLLNTLEDLTDSVNYALASMKYPTRTIEEVRSFVGHGVFQLIKSAVPNICSDTEISDTFSLFKQHYAINCNNKTKPYPEIMELLHKLNEKGYHLAIVSNKLDAAVKHLNSLYFKDLIQVAVGETEGLRKKPAPDTVNKALKELGSTKEESLYIGDSEVDILTAKNSDLPCVSVSWGFRESDYLKSQDASVIIDHPLDLLTLLDV